MRRTIHLAALAALAACDPQPETPWDTGSSTEPVVVQDGMLTTTTWRTRSDAEGLLDLAIEVGPDTTSFLVAPTTDDEYPALLTLTDPAGAVVLDAADWVDSDENLTGAFQVSRKTSALNWPVRGSDPRLTPGTWRALWSSNHEDGRASPDDATDVVVLVKDDPDPTHGTVEVRLVWAAGVEAGAGHEAAVQAAVQTWQAEWASYGLEVVPTFHTSILDPTLTFTASGGFDLEDVALEVAGPGDLVVVLGDTMVYKPNVYGTSASTPGSPYPGTYHFVAVALDMFVEPSGSISADSQRLLTDTISHEVAHYMGVPHVVETHWARWDALADTPRCGSELECEQQAGTNLMFPTSHCSPSCPQPSLTPDQQAVLHLYAATR